MKGSPDRDGEHSRGLGSAWVRKEPGPGCRKCEHFGHDPTITDYETVSLKLFHVSNDLKRPLSSL